MSVAGGTPLAPERGADHNQRFGMNVGGALKQNKSSFSLGFNHSLQYASPQLYAVNPGFDLSNVLSLQAPNFASVSDPNRLLQFNQDVLDRVKAEASVCYRLLRYLNSPMFGFQSEIHSIRHALSILGERDVRRWVRLVAAVGAGQEKTSDLVLSALVRGRFGELLSPRVAHGESDLFLMGLLSLIDAMMEMPMRTCWKKFRSTMRRSRCYWGNRARCARCTS